ncbi:hypothetical protein BOTBODRAFT_278463 [Botryobasidium botryosum FD-172 SS1]|uniref:Uncharacterized protein n=1 Tax=Botryobasidium botryosum (strain FD-172 SS1) TaxID=930990 RepID=A0A067MMN0_BOTB1|nr:hypothetical protein BOTBODRAFT_278463 [Botryobasidium botryosum FD-172 SS1]
MNHSTPSKRSAPLRLPSIPRGISDFPPILPSLPSGLLSLASSQSGSKDAGHRPKSQIPATPSRSDRSDRSDSRTSHRGALDDFLHLPASPSRPGARASHRGALDAFRHLSASPSRLGHRHVDRSTISCAPTRYTTPTPLNTLEIPATLAPSTKGVMNTSKRSPGSSLSSDTRYQARRVGSSGSVDTESASISKLSPLFGRTERGSQSSGAGPSTRPIVKNENSVSAKTFNQGSNRQWVMTAKRKWKPQPRFTADFLASAVGLAVPRQLELPVSPCV